MKIAAGPESDYANVDPYKAELSADNAEEKQRRDPPTMEKESAGNQFRALRSSGCDSLVRLVSAMVLNFHRFSPAILLYSAKDKSTRAAPTSPSYGSLYSRRPYLRPASNRRLSSSS